MTAEVPEVILGLCGRSSSGKTTVAIELANRFESNLAVLHFDSYDLYPPNSAAMNYELANPTITNWEHPKLFDIDAFVEDLKALSKGKSVKPQPRSERHRDPSRQPEIVRPAPIILVEGLFVFHDPRARELINPKFFIHVSETEMINRRLGRGSRNPSFPWDSDKYVLEKLAPATRVNVLPQAKYADYTLRGDLYSVKQLADQVIGWTGIYRQTSARR